jgi:hypothetical protein
MADIYPGYIGGKPTEPFDEENTTLFTQLTIAELQCTEGLEKELKEDMERGSFFYQVMSKRLEVVEAIVSIYTRAFLCHIAINTAEVVLWAWTLNLLSVAEDRPVTLGIWAEYFPWGIPVPEARKAIWYAQKIPDKMRPRYESGQKGPDNLVDYMNIWPRDKDRDAVVKMIAETRV